MKTNELPLLESDLQWLCGAINRPVKNGDKKMISFYLAKGCSLKEVARLLLEEDRRVSSALAV
ncbi:MAG: hypothetical protein ACK5JF_07980 [Oscillospiraceae bacterium]